MRVSIDKVSKLVQVLNLGARRARLAHLRGKSVISFASLEPEVDGVSTHVEHSTCFGLSHPVVDGADDFALGNQSQNAARVMFSYLGGNHNAEVHYEIQPIYFTEANILSGNELLGSTFALASNRYRYKDLDQYIGIPDLLRL